MKAQRPKNIKDTPAGECVLCNPKYNKDILNAVLYSNKDLKDGPNRVSILKIPMRTWKIELQNKQHVESVDSGNMLRLSVTHKAKCKYTKHIDSISGILRINV